MDNRDRESAFPWANPNSDAGDTGMTLRDYFAGQALASVVEISKIAMELGGGSEFVQPGNIAHSAYELADAMLAER